MVAVIPKPQEVSVADGSFVLNSESTLGFFSGWEGVAKLFCADLEAATGVSVPLGGQEGAFVIRKCHGYGAEGYALNITESRIEVLAEEAAGAFYATRTLLQLLTHRDGVWSVPCAQIMDAPRFVWRGSHLDVCRHFFGKEFLFRYIDLLAFHKLNVLHLHLTEDQGWRMEIKRYPKLTGVGAWRSDTMLTYDPPAYRGEPHGGFYTQEELREVVAYAAERFVTVVPEIEMPGHATAAIAAYPELGNGSNPIPVSTDWGVITTVLNVEDATLEFFRNVLDEVMEIFPSIFIHIGGDECPKEEWKASSKAQQRMKEQGLTTEEELQSWFIRQMDAYVTSKGRRLMGWSEILEGGLAPGAALMVWLGTEGAVTALQSGHDVVMAQTSHLYFDYPQFTTEPKPTPYMPVLPVEKVYAYNPIPYGVSESEEAHVLGIQFQLWTEYIPTEERLEYMAFPRACAAAEVAWTQPTQLNYADFATRLEEHVERLAVKGVHVARSS